MHNGEGETVGRGLGGWMAGNEGGRGGTALDGRWSVPLPDKNPARAATPKLWSGGASNLTRQPISGATITANTGIIQ